ncbi:topoisomerase DNA-binding C4 zinc finger domain-containing protein [Pseudoalteromonas sp. MMG006]|uniref:DNA topoisomerase family protein n=1 Tax=Pseudoalteromonas TaxID=53246 RepID=UPI001B365345|nr:MULTISPECIES: topoisomerase DNA-binding C4 zinc finger domain-containing protein [unclassified Pseudoalteromonas]MBQ4800809.1 topoisomerase DNA-binding C4 zinc finger domain-containing protein [Pseudoalteromonas sp. MMG006]MBQ4859803.1 topoisomerase DNA-binding C4 zinc finger domain-containing protein [Pseudoalteromonas sp. MMG007]
MSKIDHSLFSADKHALEKEYEICPQCGSELVIRNSKSGPFLGCASYPKCDFIRPLAHHDSNEIKILEDSACPQCTKPLVVKNGRYGMFIGCTGYPECHYIANEDDEKQNEEALPPCPKCKKGHLVARSNKFGKTFYSCDSYPSCKYTLNNKPIAIPCPECDWPLVIEKKMSNGAVLQCPQKSCMHKLAPTK